MRTWELDNRAKLEAESSKQSSGNDRQRMSKKRKAKVDKIRNDSSLGPKEKESLIS